MRYKDNLCKTCGKTFQVEFRRGTDRDYCTDACRPAHKPLGSDKPCSVAGCAKMCRSPKASLCDGHYCRLRRTGELGEKPIAVSSPKPPHCTIDGCSKPIEGNKMCAMHKARWVRHGDASVVLPRGHRAGEAWRTNTDSYQSAHSRVHAIRGTAHMCERCGAVGRRYQWAIKLAAQATAKHSRFGPYSMDINAYEQLCVPCHKSMDLTAIRSGARHHSIKTQREDRGR